MQVAPDLWTKFVDNPLVERLEVLAAERQVWNLTLGYAGTFDLLVRLRDGTIWLVDIKTGKGVYSDHALQLMAYSMAEFVGSDDVVDEAATELLRGIGGMAVLHLADDHWEFRAVRHDAATWSAFRGLLSFATWSADHDTPDSFTVAARTGREASA